VNKVRQNPLSMPAWHAMHREANLVSQLIGVGVTALGKATYASGMGEYYTAFFGLSIGIERLSKLVLIANHVLRSNGQLPDKTTVRQFGHNLVKLLDEVERVADSH